MKVVVPQLGQTGMKRNLKRKGKKKKEHLTHSLRNCFTAASFTLICEPDRFTAKSKAAEWMGTLVHLETVPEEAEQRDLGHRPPERTLNQRAAPKMESPCNLPPPPPHSS